MNIDIRKIKNKDINLYKTIKYYNKYYKSKNNYYYYKTLEYYNKIQKGGMTSTESITPFYDYFNNNKDYQLSIEELSTKPDNKFKLRKMILTKNINTICIYHELYPNTTNESNTNDKIKIINNRIFNSTYNLCTDSLIINIDTSNSKCYYFYYILLFNKITILSFDPNTLDIIQTEQHGGRPPVINCLQISNIKDIILQIVKKINDSCPHRAPPLNNKFADLKLYLNLELNNDTGICIINNEFAFNTRVQTIPQNLPQNFPDFITFLQSLLGQNIQYYYIEYSSNNVEIYRGWYFYKFKEGTNIIEVLQKFGCNCIDLINICKLKWNQFPVYECGSVLDINMVQSKLGSYESWYRYCVCKWSQYKLSKELIMKLLTNTLLDDTEKDILKQGTLLISPCGDLGNHVAIISNSESKIKIIHSVPETELKDLCPEHNGFIGPGICEEKLSYVLKNFQPYYKKTFYFLFAIPYEEWMGNNLFLTKEEYKQKILDDDECRSIIEADVDNPYKNKRMV